MVHRRDAADAEKKDFPLASLWAGQGESFAALRAGGLVMDSNKLSSKIIGAAIEVHKNLGPGLLESTYEECLCFEMSLRGLSFQRQKPLAIEYKGNKLDCGYRLDIVVQDAVIIELKACEKIEPIHKAQLLTYLKLSGLNLGLLLNFNTPVLRDGIVRIVNQLKE